MPTLVRINKGGPGSGHHGHRGRPGKRGGSVPQGASASAYPPPKVSKGEQSDMDLHWNAALRKYGPPLSLEGAQFTGTGKRHLCEQNAIKVYRADNEARPYTGTVVSYSSLYDKWWSVDGSHIFNVRDGKIIDTTPFAKDMVDRGDQFYYFGIPIEGVTRSTSGIKLFDLGDKSKKNRTLVRIKGGPGSGHRGHRGRPGKRGGSVPGKMGDPQFTEPDPIPAAPEKVVVRRPRKPTNWRKSNRPVTMELLDGELDKLFDPNMSEEHKRKIKEVLVKCKMPQSSFDGLSKITTDPTIGYRLSADGHTWLNPQGGQAIGTYNWATKTVNVHPKNISPHVLVHEIGHHVHNMRERDINAAANNLFAIMSHKVNSGNLVSWELSRQYGYRRHSMLDKYEFVADTFQISRGWSTESLAGRSRLNQRERVSELWKNAPADVRVLLGMSATHKENSK